MEVNKQENDKYVFDTSLVSIKKDICEILYNVYSGLEYLSLEDIETGLNEINYFNMLTSQKRINVISEVLEELKEYVRILNGQTEYIKNQREKGRIREEFDDIFNNICIYADKIYGLIRHCSRTDPRNNFDNGQNKNYENLLEIARVYSKDLDKISIAKNRRLINHVNLRDELETDKKIVATAFVLAYDNVVHIITKDKDIEKLVKRVGENIRRKRPYINVSIPKNSIGIINPDLGEDYSSELILFNLLDFSSL